MNSFTGSAAGVSPFENHRNKQKGASNANLFNSQEKKFGLASVKNDKRSVVVEIKIGRSNEELLNDIVSELNASGYKSRPVY